MLQTFVAGVTRCGIALAATAAICSTTDESPAAERPNVIVIFTDDQGTIDAKCFGAEDLVTPGIDSLAQRGVRLTQFYAAAPVCSPSRAGLLTGRYPVLAGVPGNVSSQKGGAGMPPEQVTMAETFKAGGCVTAHIGKWHLGYTPETMPGGQGFDFSFGHMGGCIDNFSHFFYWQGPNRHDLWRQGKEVHRDGCFFPDLMLEEAVRFITENRQRPFFMYFAMNAPHYPYQGNLKWLEHYANLEYPRNLYAAFVTTLDARIKSLVDAVTERIFPCGGGARVSTDGLGGQPLTPPDPSDLPQKLMERLARLRAHLAATAEVCMPSGSAAAGRSVGPALQIVEQAVAQQRIPGASVLVMRRGELVAAESFGTCDPGALTPPPFQKDTICYIASLTKPFTAAAAMLLVERGQLNLEDLVSKHLPEFSDLQTEDGRSVQHLLTVRDLMCHRSGLGRSFPEALRPSPFFTQAWFDQSLAEVALGISKLPLLFVPREDVAYSNTAWYVLARIIELRSGQHFGDFVRREIFGTLGMNDTGFDLPSAKVGRTAVCYSRQELGGALSLVSRYDSSWDVKMCMPDGGLWSTTADIARWASAFLDGGGGLLHADSVRAMLTQQSFGPVGPDGADGQQQRGIGLGWHLDLPHQFTHWGFTGTLVWGDQQTGVVGVMFAQMADVPVLAEIHTQFRDAVTAAFAEADATCPQ